MSWFKQSRRHSLASRGIHTTDDYKSKETYLTPLKGGLGENKNPKSFDKAQLLKGTEIEMEHTDDPLVAQRIAMDHLQEHPEYYKYLPKLEKKLKNKETLKAQKEERRKRIIAQKKHKKY